MKFFELTVMTSLWRHYHRFQCFTQLIGLLSTDFDFNSVTVLSGESCDLNCFRLTTRRVLWLCINVNLDLLTTYLKVVSCYSQKEWYYCQNKIRNLVARGETSIFITLKRKDMSSKMTGIPDSLPCVQWFRIFSQRAVFSTF